MEHDSKIIEASKKCPRPDADRKFEYGTAGFRMKAELLESTVFRVGLLASLRSRKLNSQTIGVMITASHNPPEDNGVKLVDPMGEMLESSWESYATALANAKTDEELVHEYKEIAKSLSINLDIPSRVIFARDTRPSGHRLVECLSLALDATGTEYTDYKFLTTPQLHYLVRCDNSKNTDYAYGDVSEQGYYEKIATAFKLAMKHKKTQGHVTVDCANGVGAPKLAELIKYLPKKGEEGYLEIKTSNEDIVRPETLNLNCGADFVKTQQRAPPSSKAGPLERCASLDGDADRVVYYYTNNENRFVLLDGDRIATLAASFLVDIVRQCGLSETIKVGVVQTAYANGGSTAYIKNVLGLPVECTPTGVKHLHHAAARFDIGVYFEANGHGTVLFSPGALRTIATYEPKSPGQQEALQSLRALVDLINQTVGDAISDLLLVEVILAHKDWGMEEWFNTYADLPNRLVRVPVHDRGIFKTYDAERRLSSPPMAQTLIDELVVKYKSGRTFARASGTEDVVRVYAEAETRAEADDLANKVARIVLDFGQPSSASAPAQN